MVACGVDAMAAGHDGVAMVSLAGASDDVPIDVLVVMLRAAACELGLELPPGERAVVWAATVAESLEDAGALPHRTPTERFSDDLLIVAERLSDGRVGAHVLKFVGSQTGDYGLWLEQLRVLCEAAAVRHPVDAQALRGLVSLIEGVSFGAVSPAVLRQSLALRRLCTQSR